MKLKHRIVFSIIMALFMSSLMTALICFINLGFNATYFEAWARSFMIAWPSASLIAFIFGPIVQAISAKLIA